MQQLLPILAAFLFLLTAVLAALRLFRPGMAKKISRGAVLAAGFSAVVLHALVLYFNLHTDEGINLAFFQAVSLAGWTIALVTLVSAVSKPVENLAIFMFPFIAAALLIAGFSESNMLFTAGGSWKLGLHVLTSLLAWSMFAIASVQSLLLWVQDRYRVFKFPNPEEYYMEYIPVYMDLPTLLMLNAGVLVLCLLMLLIPSWIITRISPVKAIRFE